MTTFEKFYGNLYEDQEHQAERETENTSLDKDEEWYNECITNEEVIMSLRRMKRRKAVGPDRIAIEVLKDNAILTPLVTRIYNRIFDTGSIPEEWRLAHVKPIYKGKGAAEEARNYRCIALTSHLYKAFTSILANRLILQCLPQISENQHGFVPHRSCEEAIDALMYYIDSNEGPTHAVFVDFSAAFDNVNRRKLEKTISEKFGLGGKIVSTLKSMLRPNGLIIDTGYDMSELVEQQKGVQQGDSVSPFLFVMFVNNLLERLEKRNVLVKMFADDLVIASVKKDELQRALATLSIWSEDNGMKINAEKTKAVKFRKAGATGKQKLYIQRKPIEFVPSFRYLGIVLQPALGFGEHVEQLLTRTATTIACLGNLQKIPLALAMKIFDLKIMPMIRYGMSAISKRLAKTTMHNLDRCKSLYLKSIMGLSRHTSNTFVLALAEQKTICETLKDMDYEFHEWEKYAEDIESKRSELRKKDFSAGPAFSRDDWKLSNRTDRAAICRLTYHGYHHKICTRGDFFDVVDKACSCTHCGQRPIDRYHVLSCKYFEGKTIARIVKEM